MMNKFAIGCGGLVVILLFFAFVVGLFFWGTYNRLVTLDQEVDQRMGRRCKTFISGGPI